MNATIRPLAVAAALLAGTALTIPAQAAQPVRIGVLADEAGFASDIGGKGATVAARMAVEDFGGTVLDRPIEIVSADMQNKPDVASNIVRRWFDLDGVDMVTDIPVSSVALAVQAVAREKKKVLMISAATTTELTNAQCSPYSIHWADDTASLAVGATKAVVQAGGTSWYFITADFAFGTAMEKAATDAIKQAGGSVLGSVKHPIGTSDFGSYLLSAQASGAKVVALANVGADTIGAIKQAGEFGLTAGGQRMVGYIVFITDVHSLGLDLAKGLYVTEGFYWDQNDKTRAWSKRFFERHGKMPSKEQANTYLATLHWLKAVKAAGTTDSEPVTARMKAMPTDYFGTPGSIRKDGRVLYDLALYQVKSPAESKAPWDYYTQVRSIPASEAFLPLESSTCPFVTGK
ncbi:branched-chain amino acid transport system substrate-binding protein [Azospirillum agricola]|uniref:ABC transporter substrate-binding protein n=1 Tax=Azospirillum agricola TaxID=1720247 RepID=UPI001B3C0311|nr:ABC transporter substrate-binding protein [Azospirillum agricola]MBP2227361.1 branched-chain amino acid transport system substrate-binding protein [Azospirillum agricola]